MASAAAGEVTELLLALKRGDKQAEGKLVQLIYPELRRIAQRQMRRERQDHTLQATALVHEAYLRLTLQPYPAWEGRTQFLAIAARLMRQILIDHARAHLRQKRGGGEVTRFLDERFEGIDLRPFEWLALDECLSRLTKIDSRQSQIVELRFFGGMSVEEVAQQLGVSPKTVKRDWQVARAWLYREMRRDDGTKGQRLGASQKPV
jgi:RNA polymerase sigma factor (TIGR02999 family)